MVEEERDKKDREWTEMVRNGKERGGKERVGIGMNGK